MVKSGIENINKYLVKKINEKLSLDVAFNVVDDNVLFHTKALILKNEHQGILLIGSSNFSDLGLFSQQGNYESLIFTTENDDIDDFYQLCQEINSERWNIFLNLKALIT